MDSARTIYTLGHSNHALDHFLRLLRQHALDVIVDTRSVPRSAYASQFDSAALATVLPEAGLRYLYLGDAIGGRPRDPQMYDADGHVLYERVAQTADFQRAIERLESGLERFRVALLCSEENPRTCHRRLLVSRVLFERGVQVLHIRGDGSLLGEESLRETERAAEAGEAPGQALLFEVAAERPWRSAHAVPRAGRTFEQSG